MKKKLNGFLHKANIGQPVEGKSVPIYASMYLDGVEIEEWKLKTYPNKVVIKKYIKQFDYKDMLLMNKTIQKIVGR